MRRWLGQQMARPWVARIGALIIFLGLMAALRVGLVVLRDQDEQTTINIGLPILAALMAFAWFAHRKGY